MLENLYSLGHTVLSFVVVLSVIVFIHEFGHYIVAKFCGVRITAFSIGFGKELFGWNDKSGTRWKVSAVPLGGYVKMFGDASPASNPDSDVLEQMSDEDRAVAFHYKPLYQKAMVVFAGPFANFILTTAIFFYFILSNGLPSVEPIIGKVMPESAAAEAGLQSGDKITMVDDKKVYSFNDIPYYISTNLGTEISLAVERGEEKIIIKLTPKQMESDDGLGNKIKSPRIGIMAKDVKRIDVGVPQAIVEAAKHTYMVCVTNLRAVGQIITGIRSPKELKGAIGMAQISGQATDKGFQTVLWLIANLSASIGLFNLFPIPVLDGGHLVFYSIEAVFRRKLAEKIMDWSMRIGFSLLAMLMAYTIFNDLLKLAEKYAAANS